MELGNEDLLFCLLLVREEKFVEQLSRRGSCGFV